MKQLIFFTILVVFYIGSCSPVPAPPTVPADPSSTTIPVATQTMSPISAPSATSTLAPLELGIGSTKISEVDGMTLLYVPAGEFTMGSDSGMREDKPAHTVEVEAFWIDQSEVTNEMYATCVQEGVCTEPSNTTHFSDPDYADHPVVYVSWNDANSYCTWAGRRLLTEAEWEKAARGTEGRVYPWGDTIDCSLANYWGKEDGCIGDTLSVGKYPEGASPYGVLDMGGNVLEWGSSLFKPYPYDATDGREDLSASGTRVLRGGSWNVTGDLIRSARRHWYLPLIRHNYVGFRCAMNSTP